MSLKLQELAWLRLLSFILILVAFFVSLFEPLVWCSNLTLLLLLSTI